MLVIADSSFSMVAAMLANVTVLAPDCSMRPHLPHWHAIPCGHGRRFQKGRVTARSKIEGARDGPLAAAVREVVDTMQWPPPHGRLRG